MTISKKTKVQKVQKSVSETSHNKEVCMLKKCDIARVREILKNPSPIQYLKVTHDLTFRDYRSRRTTIAAGECGYVLDEEQIVRLPNASAEQKNKMITDMMECFDRDAILALVCGYPCVLMQDDYQLLNHIPNHCCGEIV